jgi:hypothetical protein
MKTKSFTIASFFIICLFTLTSMTAVQDTQIFEGVYDGNDDYGYNFIGMDEDGEEFTMTFQNIDDVLLKSFNLNTDKLVGSKFTVSYTSKTEKLEDEDGYEDDVEVYTITALKKL